ncbi:TetR/AcrR family transcriptional regulator [Aeromicrobium sp.]|uniref:TetR/AcrR family transcriptional regulator n=1 Tax=Aeromicrobium sp. TaxID=1871063 RepID=UPI0035120471
MTRTSTVASAGPRRRPRAELREVLLDVAERSFARSGYAGVGVREITRDAGVRTATVSEVFGGKRELFRAVLLRRVEPLNAERRTRLVGATSLDDVVRAFTEPMLEQAGRPGWADYFRFVAQLSVSALPEQVLVAEEYNAIAATFVGRLQDLYPDARPEAVLDAYLLLVSSSLQLFGGPGRFEYLTEGTPGAPDLATRHDWLVRFAVGGLDTLLRDV